MSPALPVVKARACLHALERAGFYIHHVTIPLHNRDLLQPLLKSILRQAELTVEEFTALL